MGRKDIRVLLIMTEMDELSFLPKQDRQEALTSDYESDEIDEA